MENFRLYFNHKRQFVDVYLHAVTPETFHRWGGGRWAWYQPAEGRTRRGVFGELHFVLGRVRADTVAHELLHLLADRLRVRHMELNERNEERIATMFDELTRNFWREYERTK